MYVPAHFEESRPEVLRERIRTHPLGAIVTRALVANHLPFHLGEGSLIAHVARKNPLWREMKDGEEVLVMFGGDDAYVSPNWYPSKHETHQQVPTWNYFVVHVHGRVFVRDDVNFVRTVVAQLTKEHEAKQPTPWKMSDSPREFIDALLQEIVGIEVVIDRIVGKAKVGQNREPRDARGAADALRASGHVELADEMLKRQ
ncbi:MAG: FMN-binding negative transcriptional regulator [Archangium sp.]